MRTFADAEADRVAVRLRGHFLGRVGVERRHLLVRLVHNDLHVAPLRVLDVNLDRFFSRKTAVHCGRCRPASESVEVPTAPQITRLVTTAFRAIAWRYRN